ncbi:hypothetical protein D9757_002053 [Collybiopsis confluens]|uniref:Integral membrane protein n=1 Tax=Collybiopsis confluens TaxID=2823264 RepID=A0A8H5HXN6_9AGAR|nr:hypothetical protein D9757_002053 [Collybiopsis confluens]
MSRSLFIPILLAGMIITGACNSLWSKYQDMQCVENCDGDISKQVLYEQPVWQTLQMFLGEMLCFLPVIYSWAMSKRFQPVQLPNDNDGSDDSSDTRVQTVNPAKLAPAPQELRGWRVLLFWIPAACDLTGTTLMNVGLLYTPVSIYQMSRGSLVLFVGFLSVVFLRRRLWLYQWMSLIIVMTGVALVGFSGSLTKDAVKEAMVTLTRMSISPFTSTDLPPPEPIDQPEVTTVLVGVFFIIFAQIFTATQFVVEEKILSQYSVPPLVAVGLEGFFGSLTILLFFPVLALPSVSSRSPFFDIPRGWHQMVDTPSVLWSGVVIAFSIALFNFFGLSVTRHVSATARSLVDTCRTLAIWIVLGFALLVYGTFLFNNLVAVPPCLPRPSDDSAVTDDEEAEGLLETATLPADLGQGGFDAVPEGEHAVVRRTGAAN